MNRKTPKYFSCILVALLALVLSHNNSGLAEESGLKLPVSDGTALSGALPFFRRPPLTPLILPPGLPSNIRPENNTIICYPKGSPPPASQGCNSRGCPAGGGACGLQRVRSGGFEEFRLLHLVAGEAKGNGAYQAYAAEYGQGFRCKDEDCSNFAQDAQKKWQEHYRKKRDIALYQCEDEYTDLISCKPVAFSGGEESAEAYEGEALGLGEGPGRLSEKWERLGQACGPRGG